MDLQGPKLFCGNTCRDNFFSRAPENVHKLERIQTQMEYYKADRLFWYHKSGEPTFLHDITVEEDESFNIDGVFTKNCRCLMASIFPGMGFENGILQYIGPDHDEYEAQKNVVKKSLNHEEFAKHDCDEHRHK